MSLDEAMRVKIREAMSDAVDHIDEYETHYVPLLNAVAIAEQLVREAEGAVCEAEQDSGSPEARAVDKAKQQLGNAVDMLGLNYVRWYAEQYAARKREAK